MTQREAGPGSPDEPADDLEEAGGSGDMTAATDAADVEAGEELESDGAEQDGETADGASEPADGAESADPTAGAAPQMVPAAGAAGSKRRRGEPVSRPAPAPTPSELAVRIDDRVSQILVIVAVGFFSLLFVYALLFGGSGLLTPAPTPRPTPVPTAAPSPTPAPSPSASA